jgi:hypothetical protein
MNGINIREILNERETQLEAENAALKDWATKAMTHAWAQTTFVNARAQKLEAVLRQVLQVTTDNVVRTLVQETLDTISHASISDCEGSG